MHIAGDVIVVICMALAAWAVVSVVSAAMDRAAALPPTVPDHLHFTRLCIIEHNPDSDKPYVVWFKPGVESWGFACRTKSEAQQLVLSLEHKD